MPDPIRILICPLSTHERDGWWCPTLGKFLTDLCHMNGFVTGVCPLHAFVPAAGARNAMSKRVADEEAGQWDWLCMIDNDMVPTFDLLDIVKDAPPEAGIVVPEFSIFNEAEKSLKLCWHFDGYGGQPIALTRGWHELTKCGTGCIFIRPSALRAIPYPYFTYVYNEDGMQTGTEDITFCEKARAAGIRIFGNNRFIVGHYKSVNLSVFAEMLFSQKRLDEIKAKSVDFVPSVERPSNAEAR